MLFEIMTIPQDVKTQKQLTSMHIDEWVREDVFKLRWWILVCLAIAVLFIWWIMLDKSRIYEICIYVVLAIIIVMALVEYGEELTLWDYPTDIIPIFPPLTSVNLISLPLIYSIIYQRFNSWKSFIFTCLVVTTIINFIVEPMLVWGGFFQLLKWKYYYNFPIYAGMAICVRTVVLKIYSITEKYRNKGKP